MNANTEARKAKWDEQQAAVVALRDALIRAGDQAASVAHLLLHPDQRRERNARAVLKLAARLQRYAEEMK
jgi:hypothetical protein